MDGEIDLSTADRDLLIAIIVRQQAIIERLEKRVAQLEGRDKSGGTRRMPGLKPKAEQRPAQPKKPPKPRPHGFARARMTPTQRVEHVVEECPDCGTQLSGGWTQRTREVIDLPQVPVQVTEHVYMARTCPLCRRCCVPPAQLDGVVMGKQRLGVNLVSLIVNLREEARLPFRTIQWYLDAVHGLRLSLGAIVDATQRAARQAQGMMANIVERIRGSPVVHADETGWREDGHNGYVWTFSTPTLRYFLRRGRGKAVVDEVLSDQFAGVLVSDFYAAYHHYDGPKQRCWAHLLRDIHDLCALYPDDQPLAQWADAIQQLYRRATAITHPQAQQRPEQQRPEQQRRTARLALEQRLLALCHPYLDDPSAAQARLCRRIQNHIKELFLFVSEPAVPPDNNAAERSLRPLVISRKISGGSRSAAGTDTKMTLASVFGTWRVQGLNPLTACRQLLASPSTLNCYEKTRHGSRVVKRYSPPATPCDRLMQHDAVSVEMQAALSEYRVKLDPVALLHAIREAQSALAAVTFPAIRPTPSGESLEQFLAKLPDWWRQDAAHTSRERRVQPPRTWRTRPDPFARPFRRSVVRRAVLVAGRPGRQCGGIAGPTARGGTGSFQPGSPADAAVQGAAVARHHGQKAGLRHGW